MRKLPSLSVLPSALRLLGALGLATGLSFGLSFGLLVGCDGGGAMDAGAVDAGGTDAGDTDAGGADAGGEVECGRGTLPTSSYLLVTNNKTHEVVRFDQETGAYLDTLVAPGVMDRPDQVALRDGLVYVSAGQTVEDSAILRFCADTGALFDRFATGGGLHRPFGFAFGADDRLYVASYYTDQILRYDATTGAFLDVFAEGDGRAGGLNGPVSLVFGPDGRLYVSTIGSVAVDGEPTFPGLPSEILRYDIGTGAVELFAGEPPVLPEGDGYVSLNGMAFGPDCATGTCDLFVTDYTGGIRRFDMSGSLIDTITTQYGEPPEGRSVGSLTFGDEGRMFTISFDGSPVRVNNPGVLLRWDASITPLPGAGLTGALLNAEERNLWRPLGIFAVAVP